MINLIIIILLLFGLLMGLKRGFILQTLHLVGFITAFVVASLYYGKLAPHLTLWIPYPDLTGNGSLAEFLQAFPLETGFYNAISFAIIFFGVKIILQIIASMLDFVAELPLLSTVNRLFGAILGFLEIYLILFIIMFIMALTPVVSIQEWINSSSIALNMLENTPYLSEQIETLWFTQMDSLLNLK